MDSIQDLVRMLTLEEKASLCSGESGFDTVGIERVGLKSMTLTDGPNGIRINKALISPEQVMNSEPATCFPSASAIASSWDVALAEEVGAAIGKEGKALGVDILLAPGVNMKRSPLCGRNFEYFSEDPCLAGDIAAAFVTGLQEQGVGAMVKHFACNNTETERLTVSAELDERTLREIYLAVFERVIKKAHPWAVMAAYNKVNGEYATENKYLLTEILRNEWEFDGIVVSDWGAVNNRLEAAKAGLDLEMPGPSPHNTRLLINAVKNDLLDESVLDKIAERIIRVAKKSADKSLSKVDYPQHHFLARRAAAESFVLLKNQGGLLPIKKSNASTIAVIGEIARRPRFQGFGSSYVNAIQTDNAFDEICRIAGSEYKITYSAGYTETDTTDNDLLRQAIENAVSADVAVVFIGLPMFGDSEGIDRKDLEIPESHVALLQNVAAHQPNVAVILSNGSAISMDTWLGKVPAVLETWLCGQAGGGAIADVLFGIVNPSGKLAETFPYKLSHNPSHLDFPSENGKLHYGERTFAGYRYYEKKDVKPMFPFGFGLSYTNFEYSDMVVSSTNIQDVDELTVSLKIKNSGARTGKEIVQLYVKDRVSSLLRPEKELKSFAKILLYPGEVKEIAFTLSWRDFAFFHPSYSDWVTEDGEFEILLGSSSSDIRLKKVITMRNTKVYRKALTKESFVSDWLSDPNGHQIIMHLIHSGKIIPHMPLDSPLFAQFCSAIPLKKFVVTKMTIDDESIQLVDEIVSRWAEMQ